MTAQFESQIATAGSTSVALTTGTVTVSGATADRLLVAKLGIKSGSITSISDDTGNWTKVHDNVGSNANGAMFYRIASGTSADDFDASWVGGSREWALVIDEYSGTATSSPLNVSAEYTNNVDTESLAGAPIGPVTATPSFQPGIAVTGIAQPDERDGGFGAGEISVDNSFTNINGYEPATGNNQAVGLASKRYTSTSAISASWDTSRTGDWRAYVTLALFNEASAGTNISATTDALTLTEYAASVNAATNIAATVDNLTVTEYAATVQAGSNTTIDATSDALVLTEYAANVNAATNISASVDALTVTEYQASITAGTEISATVDNLTLATYQATVALENTYINADVATLTLNEYPASITYTGETQAYTGGFNVYSRIQTEKEKRRKRIEMGIIEDLPKPQQKAVKKAAQTENKAVARAVLNQEVERLQGNMEALDAEIQAELLRQRTDELIDAYQAEMRDILKEIEAEQAELFVFNQRNRNAVAVLMMMN